jgi:hypothetical protein
MGGRRAESLYNFFYEQPTDWIYMPARRTRPALLTSIGPGHIFPHAQQGPPLTTGAVHQQSQHGRPFLWGRQKQLTKAK